MDEAVRVAERCGVRLDVADCKARVQLVAEQTAGECFDHRMIGSESKLHGFGYCAEASN